jgi:lipoyl(octanoyl) transferase
VSRPLHIERLGLVPYAEALELQEKRIEAVRAAAAPDTLLLLEHPPVVTLGRSAKPQNLLLSPDELTRRGVERFEVARGGDVTFHGPGQLVGYLVCDLAARGVPDAHGWLRGIEAALIAALSTLGVRAATRTGFTGVFVDDPAAEAAGLPPRKIASIGIGLRGWTSWHGFALNVSLDPQAFDLIVPCGLHGVRMTSVAHELREKSPRALDRPAREAVATAFEAWLS